MGLSCLLGEKRQAYSTFHRFKEKRYNATMDKRSSKTISKIYDGFTLCLQSIPYSKLKVRDIIQKSQISPTGFYAHFKSKEEVLQGYMARLFLTVKIKGKEQRFSSVSLLFARIESYQDTLSRFLQIKENTSLLRSSLFPWARSFLPNALTKEGQFLACDLLVDTTLRYIEAENESERKAFLAKLLLTLPILLS